jgi:hypothetical protein
MLRIPGAGDTPPPLTKKSLKMIPVSLPESFQRSREKLPAVVVAVAPTAEVTPDDAEQNSTAEPVLKRREKKRRRPEASAEDQPDWDKAPTHRKRVVKGDSKRRWVIGTLAVAMMATILVGIGLVIQRRQSAASGPVIAVAPAPVATVAESAPENIELPLEMNRNELELVAELEPLTKKFLEATTVEELLPLVRDRDKVEPKIRKFYPDGKVPAPGMSGFNATGNIAYRSKLASVSVRTREFELKQIAFIRMADGLKVDWESYVGWSEMSWAEFLTKKPTQPVLFRASLKAVEYYNFSFSDDRVWSSFQFRSADGESVVYGYAKKDSALSARLQPNDPKGTSLVTVRLKFLPGEASKNQVVIDSFVADGWVEGID